ncbi:MAG: hypothetical protein GXO77_11895, partial [Calditrichaeota bacterium]|nr:hypothetical protein [Calditrichota bacterium]
FIKNNNDHYTILGNISGIDSSKTHGLLLLQTDSNGQIQWKKIYNKDFPVQGTGIVKTSSGGYMLLENIVDKKNQTILLINVDINGNIIWEKTYNDSLKSFGHSIASLDGKNFFVGGYQLSGDRIDSDLLIFSFDNTGKIIWTKTIGVKGYNEVCKSLYVTKDSSIVLAGEIFPSTILLIKMDKKGNLIWKHSLKFKNSVSVNKIKELEDGGSAIVGEIKRNVFLIKTDNNGNFIRSGQYKFLKNSIGYDIDEASDNSIVIIGTTEDDVLNKSNNFLLNTYSLKQLNSTNKVMDNN